MRRPRRSLASYLSLSLLPLWALFLLVVSPVGLPLIVRLSGAALVAAAVFQLIRPSLQIDSAAVQTKRFVWPTVRSVPREQICGVAVRTSSSGWWLRGYCGVVLVRVDGREVPLTETTSLRPERAAAWQRWVEAELAATR